MSHFLQYEQDGRRRDPDDEPARDAQRADRQHRGRGVRRRLRRRSHATRTVRAVILTGAGPVFSSGGNVKDMQRFFDDALTPAAIREEYRHGIQRIPLALYNLDVPTIAAVNGPAIGAGCDLACMCDIRIASENATLRRELRQGRHRAGRRRRLAAAARGRHVASAAEMAFTGEPSTPQEALGLRPGVARGAARRAAGRRADSWPRASPPTRRRRCA